MTYVQSLCFEDLGRINWWVDKLSSTNATFSPYLIARYVPFCVQWKASFDVWQSRGFFLVISLIWINDINICGLMMWLVWIPNVFIFKNSLKPELPLTYHVVKLQISFIFMSTLKSKHWTDMKIANFVASKKKIYELHVVSKWKDVYSIDLMGIVERSSYAKTIHKLYHNIKFWLLSRDAYV